MNRQGLSLEVVMLDLVAPAARLLGEQWKEDLRGFTEVSAGLGMLTIDKPVALCPDAPADTVSWVDDGDGGAHVGEIARRNKTREASPDDQDGRTAQRRVG